MNVRQRRRDGDRSVLSARLTFLVTITHRYRNYRENDYDAREDPARRLYYGFRH